jgi:enoyl-CoA hydratase/carnithine racemase
MWLYRLGLTKAKELALSGKPLSGREALEAGLINGAVPFARLHEEVRARARQLATIPLCRAARRGLCQARHLGRAFRRVRGGVRRRRRPSARAARRDRRARPYDPATGPPYNARLQSFLTECERDD